jgi:hypothetical protein
VVASWAMAARKAFAVPFRLDCAAAFVPLVGKFVECVVPVT